MYKKFNNGESVGEILHGFGEAFWFRRHTVVLQMMHVIKYITIFDLQFIRL